MFRFLTCDFCIIFFYIFFFEFWFLFLCLFLFICLFLQHINGMAQIKLAKFGCVDMDFVLGVGGYDLERSLCYLFSCVSSVMYQFLSLKDKGILLQPKNLFHVKFFVIFISNQYFFFLPIFTFSIFSG